MIDYIGDEVYVEFDGYAIYLKVNNLESPTDSVYLEPREFDALIRFAKKVGIKSEELK